MKPTRLKKIKREERKRTGSYMVEIVLVPTILLFAIFLPLVDLVSTTMRASFLWEATRDAAFYAAKSKSFAADISAKDQSATNVARSIATMEAAAYNYVTVDSVNTWILVTDVNTQATTRQQTVLATAPNSDQYIYQIEVVVTGRVKPLLLFSPGMFGNIPGLTQWISLTMRSREYFEYPQGLML